MDDLMILDKSDIETIVPKKQELLEAGIS